MNSSAGYSSQILSDRSEVYRSIRRRTLLSFGVLTALLIYLAYIWFAFDMAGLIQSAKPERAALLGNDAIAHKIQVTKSMRTEELEVAIEGERTATYTDPPAWVAIDGRHAEVSLGDGYSVKILDRALEFVVPTYGTVYVAIVNNRIETTLPAGKEPPQWLRATNVKFDARPDLGKRVQMSRAKIEVHRYFPGWENFYSLLIPNSPSSVSVRFSSWSRVASGSIRKWPIGDWSSTLSGTILTGSMAMFSAPCWRLCLWRCSVLLSARLSPCL